MRPTVQSRHFSHRASERGAALLAALCFATVLVISLGSYLTVCYRTLALSTRTLQGSLSIQLAEVGMEDALWALNNNDWSGWTLAGSNATKTTSGFAYDGGVTGDVTLTVANYQLAGGTRTLTVSGTIHTPSGPDITRTLTATSAPAALFVNAIAATTGTVRFQSAGTVDSFDSSLGSFASQTPGYSAVVSSASTGTSSATVQLTNAQIKGYVTTLSTGPSYSTSAKVVGPTTPLTTKIDSTRLTTSPYQPSFDEVPASGASTIVPNHTATIGTAGATTPAIYSATDIILNKKDTLTIDGPVIMTVSGSVSLIDTSKIRITTNGSLELHVAGDLSIGGSGIQNDTQLASNCVIIRMGSTAGLFTMANTTPFYGVVYAPNSDLTVTSNQALYGALVAKSVTFSASPTFHYDLNLRSTVIHGLESAYALSGWRETTNGG